MKKSTLLKTVSLSAVLALPGLGITPAAAQLDEIVITAQKRAQSIQDVPIAITALDTEQLENSGVNDIKDLINIAPGLMVTTTTNDTSTTARIRGIGTVGDNTGLESSVGVFVDGVYRNRNGVGFNDLGEIDRVEILRGPQGTLFGKNTSAGVLHVITKKPDYEQSAGIEVTAGNFGLYRLGGYVNGGNAESNAAFRLYAATSKRDGFMDVNVGAGPRSSDESYTSDFSTIRGQALFEPQDGFSVRLIADYTTREEDCCTAVQIQTGPTAAILSALNGGNAAVASPADPEERLAYSNRPTDQEITDKGVSAEINWDLSMGTLTSITSWRSWDGDAAQDVDFSAADIAYRDLADNGSSFDTVTQELRLNGSTDRLDWMIGAFYANEELERRDALRFGAGYETYLSLALSAGTNPSQINQLVNGLGLGAFNGVGIPPITGFTAIAPGASLPSGGGMTGDVYNQDGTTFAVFTHNTFALTDATDLTVGLRYSTEEKDFDATYNTNAPGCSVIEQQFGDGISDLVRIGGLATALALPPTTTVTALQTICLPWARSAYDNTAHTQNQSFDDLQGVLRVSHDFTDDLMGYAGLSRGFKAGGFNLDRSFNYVAGSATPTSRGTLQTQQDTTFQPEIVTAYEAGFKSTLAEGAVLLNGNIFYQEIEDFQLNTFTGTNFVVNNIEAAETVGAEVDFAWAPDVEGLTFTGGAAFIEAEYDEDILNPALAGAQMTLSPKFMANLAMTYEKTLSNDMVALFHIEGRSVSDYNTGSDLDAEKIQEGFTLLNGRIGLGPQDRNWSVQVWGKNLTDETYYQVAFDAPLQTGSWNAFLSAPRTYGISLNKEF
ncbi:MAG: TonB-dependent receptor [Parvularculaceae bacterium]